MPRLCNTILEEKILKEKKSHTGENIADISLNFLQEKSIECCRGQSYDNASQVNTKGGGVSAVESNADAAAIFWLVQMVYTFYSASTKL